MQEDSWQPRRAGDHQPGATPGQEGIRDWQRNTWQGPAPEEINPFDEPEDAPELRQSRSDNVNDHAGEFWNQQPTGYQPGMNPPVAAPAKPGKRNSRRKAVLLVATPVLVLLAAFLILRFGVYVVREIQVEGIYQRTVERLIPNAQDLEPEVREIIAQQLREEDEKRYDDVVLFSGIRKGDGILFISNEQVEKRVNADYHVTFKYLEKQMPGGVVIHVKEREPCCWVLYCGIFYAMDKNRMVLTESELAVDREPDASGDEEAQENQQEAQRISEEEKKRQLEEKAERARIQGMMDTLAEVKGLDIRSGNHLGQTVVLASREQQEAMSQLFLEMKVLSCTGLIQEADLSNLSSSFLVTRDGFTVALGAADDFHAKLRSMLLVRQELRNMGYASGIINVSNPQTPSFSPPEG